MRIKKKPSKLTPVKSVVVAIKKPKKRRKTKRKYGGKSKRKTKKSGK
jgi:hypothetical protein